MYTRVSRPVIGPGLGTDIVAGFLAGATGVGFNCWTDVCRSIVQKQAIADTFDPNIPRPSALSPYNPIPFFGEAAKLHGAKGIAGLYARGPKDGSFGRWRCDPGGFDAQI